MPTSFSNLYLGGKQSQIKENLEVELAPVDPNEELRAILKDKADKQKARLDQTKKENLATSPMVLRDRKPIKY